MLKNLSLLFILVFLFSCQDTPTQSKPSVATKQEASQHEAAAPPPAYPPLPQGIFEQIATQTDYIDYVYYNLPISMSMNDPNSINSVYRHFTPLEAPIKKQCKSIGRISFMSKGVIIAEAEMYYGADNCNYFVFLEENKPKYANQMSQVGVDFYANAFKSAQTQFNNQ